MNVEYRTISVPLQVAEIFEKQNMVDDLKSSFYKFQVRQCGGWAVGWISPQ